VGVEIFVEGLGPRTWRIHHLPSLASSLLVAGLWLGFLEGEVDLEHNVAGKEVLAVDFLQLLQFQSGKRPSLHPFLGA
jgi:hypothetical protein